MIYHVNKIIIAVWLVSEFFFWMTHSADSITCNQSTPTIWFTIDTNLTFIPYKCNNVYDLSKQPLIISLSKRDEEIALRLDGNNIPTLTEMKYSYQYQGENEFELKIVCLYLNSSQIKTVATGAFDKLTELVALDLQHNKLESFPSSQISPLTKLVLFTIASNNVKYIPPGSFKNMRNLTYLFFMHCGITHVDSGTFSSSSLKLITLRDNLLQNLSTDVIFDTPLHTEFNLKKNRFICDCELYNLTLIISNNSDYKVYWDVKCDLKDKCGPYISIKSIEPDSASAIIQTRFKSDNRDRFVVKWYVNKDTTPLVTDGKDVIKQETTYVNETHTMNTIYFRKGFICLGCQLRCMVRQTDTIDPDLNGIRVLEFPADGILRGIASGNAGNWSDGQGGKRANESSNFYEDDESVNNEWDGQDGIKVEGSGNKESVVKSNYDDLNIRVGDFNKDGSDNSFGLINKPHQLFVLIFIISIITSFTSVIKILFIC